MKGYKKIEMANFNCTFGEKDDPMIKHFNDIIYPAFNSGIRRTKNKNEYLFEDIRLIKSRKDEFVLVGLLVKKTQLEVKSLYKEGKGIQPTNLVYDSDPYSAFAIFLKNHRMIYIKNQKGSPNIQTFGSTAREIIKKFTRVENKKRGKNEKLADAYINVTKIPSSKSIEQQFSEIEKIKRVTFRLYPLNGDIEINGIFDGFRRQLENVNSKSGNMSINTPKDKMEVSKLISAAGDKADTVLKAVSIDGVEKDFKNEDFSEKIPIYLPEEEEEIYKNIAYAINQVVEKDEIKNVSNENKKNYEEAYNDILNLYNRQKQAK